MNRLTVTTEVLPLRAVGATDLASAGGKAANLGELIRIGMPVPDGFVISTDAYRGVAESGVGLVPDSNNSPAGLRTAWAAAQIPQGLRSMIVEAYRRSGSGRVAVRSSATAEDLPGAAFAGQQDTFLDVEGADALIDAVRRCWASLWTDRAAAYRDRLGIPADDVAIAVVVQQMAPASVAGVMFTADPVSGERDRIVIDAAPGLGEAVVSGLVTPDHYRLDADGAVLEHRAGEVGTMIGAATTAATDGRLFRAELARLAELGSRVAGHYQRPMDIEWAVVRAANRSQAGEVRLLQARPITGLPSEPVELTPLQRRANQVALDYLPVRPYPLDMSTWTRRGVAKMLGDLAASVGVRLDLAGAFVESDGVVDSFRPVEPRPTAATLLAPISLVRRIRRFPADGWRQDPRYRRFRELLQELSRRPAAELSWEELLERVTTTVDAAQVITDLRVDYLPAAGVGMGRLWLISALLGHRRLAGDLLIGAPTVTATINGRLAELAATARQTPAIMTHAGQLGGTELLTALQQDPAGAGFCAELEEFLTEFGCRETDSPLVVSSPTWSDAPGEVVDLIMMLARPDDHETADRDSESVIDRIRRGGVVDRGRSARALDRMTSRRLLRRPAVRRRLQSMIEDARAGVVVREDTHFELLRPAPLLRHALIELGRRLEAAEVLATAADVWHLRIEEIERIGTPGHIDPAQIGPVRAIVERRKAIRTAYGRTPLLNAVVPDPDGDALLIGTPASGGQVTGPVRIVRGVDEFGTLRAGEVLVCPNTNPSWTPLFQRAAAVVVDTGGAGSHAAIVAREYGIPAVMGTRNGTSLLVDGQQVTVDGDHGQVR